MVQVQRAGRVSGALARWRRTADLLARLRFPRSEPTLRLGEPGEWISCGTPAAGPGRRWWRLISTTGQGRQTRGGTEGSARDQSPGLLIRNQRQQQGRERGKAQVPQAGERVGKQQEPEPMTKAAADYLLDESQPSL